MHDQQHHETLAKLSVGMLTVHIWLALGYSWYQVLLTGFFGVSLLGWVIAGATLIFLISLGTLFAKQVLQELLRSLLRNQRVSSMGCMTGMASFIGLGFLFVWAIPRDINLAWWVFMLAPPLGLGIAFGVTLLKPLLRRLPNIRRSRP